MAAASVSANPRKLTAAPQPSSSQLNKPARQLVPAFLQKLYEMVNDSENHHLIRWSDTGDSFFVLDQERFASEVLGRWFKHKNFSSFVRQLNMYGFHKIPHLQQGVLRSENETEFWNFEHPHFIRGKPDMLHLIQRKKQTQPVANANTDGNALANPVNDNAGDTVGLSQNQLVDINSIVNGIQAISRHQAAISTDLNELKASNQRLWQEALVSRERHKKHQDTINCIVRFLASVFGHVEQMRKNDDGHGRTHTVIPRNPQRLMIGDGKHRKGGVEPSEDGSQLVHSPSMSLFGSVDTPQTAPAEPLVLPTLASIELSVNDAPPQKQLPQNNNDAIVQAALTQVLNSPSHMQKFLHALNQSIPNDMFPHQLSEQNQQQLIGPYGDIHYGNGVDAAIDINSDRRSHTPSFEITAPTTVLSPFTLSFLGGTSDADQLVPFEKHEERLQRTYHTAAEISNDVDELQSNIDSFIQTLGIDPGSLDVANSNHTDGVGGSPPDGGGGGGGSGGSDNSIMKGNTTGNIDMFTGPDFDLDTLLMDIPHANDDEDADFEHLAEHLDSAAAITKEPQSRLAGASDQLPTFLHEVTSQDGSDISPSIRIPVAAPPHHLKHTSIHQSPLPFQTSLSSNANVVAPSTTLSVSGRKRKPEDMDAGDVHDIVPPQSLAVDGPTSAASPNKSKRKR